MVYCLLVLHRNVPPHNAMMPLTSLQFCLYTVINTVRSHSTMWCTVVYSKILAFSSRCWWRTATDTAQFCAKAADMLYSAGTTVHYHALQCTVMWTLVYVVVNKKPINIMNCTVVLLVLAAVVCITFTKCFTDTPDAAGLSVHYCASSLNALRYAWNYCCNAARSYLMLCNVCTQCFFAFWLQRCFRVCPFALCEH
jgi:hypothetical protein